jgi:hypothetical protein
VVLITPMSVELMAAAWALLRLSSWVEVSTAKLAALMPPI